MAKETRSLGVDCASRKSGLAVVEGKKLLYHEAYDSALRPGWSDSELGNELNLFCNKVSKLAKDHQVDIVVVEFSGGWRNPNTIRALSYFEAAAVMGARKAKKMVLRARTNKARLNVVGKPPKNKAKEHAIAAIRNRYPKETLTEDEAEAILFALYGVSMLN